MTTAKIVFLVSVCLLTATCTSSGPPSLSVSLSNPVPKRMGITDSMKAGQEMPRLEPVQRERKGAVKGKLVVTSSSRTVPEGSGAAEEDFESGQAIEPSESGLLAGEESDEAVDKSSIVVVKGGGEDEEFRNLLSSDYLLQFDIPIVFNDAVQYFVRYFSTEKRKIFTNWLRRSRRYVPMIRQVLKEHGLPEDLAFVAMIESGFNPKAYSSMKACGPWQFIYETGGRYGLRVDHWVDERRDPEKSTIAAALYLKDLFNQFGDWYLAAAGYNAGEKRIERAVERHETADFWEIAKYNTLPRETKDYIPRLIASAIIAKDPERFGFTNIVYDKPITVVSEKVPGGTPLITIARVASTEYETLRALNPELLTGITPPDISDYTVKLPGNTIRGRFTEQLRAAVDSERKLREVIAYTCKPKDSMASIAKRHKVSKKDILMVNDCDRELLVQQDRVLYVPHFVETPLVGTSDRIALAAEVRNEPRVRRLEGKSKGLEEEKEETIAAKAATRSKAPPYHVVKKGETLAAISLKYGIETSKLKEMNGLGKNAIRANMRLRLAAHDGKDRKGVRTAAYHLVRKGETLSGIANRYDMDMVKLKEINRLKKNNVRSGMRLKITSAQIKPSKRG